MCLQFCRCAPNRLCVVVVLLEFLCLDAGGSARKPALPLTHVGCAVRLLLVWLARRFVAECLHQQLRIVRNNSVHAHCSGLQHFAGIIDGPGDHGLTGGMKLGH